VTVGLLRCVNNGFTMVKYISTLVPGVASLYTFATINESGMHLLSSSNVVQNEKTEVFSRRRARPGTEQ
jgi:hypothetical protein